MTKSELDCEWDSDTPLPIIFGSQRMSVHSMREDGTLIKHETVYIWPNTKKVVICPPEGVEVEVRAVQDMTEKSEKVNESQIDFSYRGSLTHAKRSDY